MTYLKTRYRHVNEGNELRFRHGNSPKIQILKVTNTRHEPKHYTVTTGRTFFMARDTDDLL